MTIDCAKCGMRARPYDAMCRNCNERVQELAAALAKKAEWDAAPPAVVADMEKNFAQLEVIYRDYIEWLRKYRNFQMVIAAVLFTIPMSMTAINLSWLCLLFDVGVGAAIGRHLNKIRGGRFQAMAWFGGMGIVSILFKICTRSGGSEGFIGQGGSVAGAMVIVALPSCGLLVAAVAGAFLGLKMEFDYDRFV